MRIFHTCQSVSAARVETARPRSDEREGECEPELSPIVLTRFTLPLMLELKQPSGACMVKWTHEEGCATRSNTNMGISHQMLCIAFQRLSCLNESPLFFASGTESNTMASFVPTILLVLAYTSTASVVPNSMDTRHHAHYKRDDPPDPYQDPAAWCVT